MFKNVLTQRLTLLVLTGGLLIIVVLGLFYYFEERFDFERAQKKNEEIIEGLEKKMEKEKERFQELPINPFAPNGGRTFRQNQPRYVTKTINGFVTAVDGDRYLRVVSPRNETFCFGQNIVIKWESGGLNSISVSIKETETPLAGPFGNSSYPMGTFPASYNERGEQDGSGEVPWKVGSIGGPDFPAPFEIFVKEGKVFQVVASSQEDGRLIEDTSDSVFSITKCEG